MYASRSYCKKSNDKPVVMQHYCINQINNGGPAKGALLIMNSRLRGKYKFVPLEQTYAPHGINFELLNYFFKKIKKENPDILHIRGLQSEGLYGVLAGKFAGCKRIVVSVHGFYGDDLSSKGFKKFAFSNLLEPITLRMADLVYCVCEYATKRKIMLRHASRLYGYIWNPAPDYSEYDKRLVREKTRKKLEISDEDIVLITVSRVSIDKGFPYLISAIKKINVNDKIKFLIVGDGPYCKTVRDLLEPEIKSGKVILTGKSSQVPELLLSSDIFVFPSLHENLSNALLEACAASLPCIATNVGGNPEVIVHEQSGILIEPNSPDALRQAMELLISSEDLRIQYGKQANKRIKHYFSQDKILDQIDTMYNFLLDNLNAKDK